LVKFGRHLADLRPDRPWGSQEAPEPQLFDNLQKVVDTVEELSPPVANQAFLLYTALPRSLNRMFRSYGPGHQQPHDEAWGSSNRKGKQAKDLVNLGPGTKEGRGNSPSGFLGRRILKPEVLNAHAQLAGKCTGMSLPRPCHSSFPAPKRVDGHPDSPGDRFLRESGGHDLGTFQTDLSDSVHDRQRRGVMPQVAS
jgi:hypothetical protein